MPVKKSKGLKQSTSKDLGRKVVHPKVVSKVRIGKDAITVEEAKQLLGWEEDEEDKFGSNFLYKQGKVKIRCTNNVENRPLYVGTITTLKQEHLRNRWQFNGEPLIIGRTGLILNGQHTLISFIEASTEYVASPTTFPHLKKAPTLEKLIVYGIDESDTTVNTMDTCKPRSLFDVIYRVRYFKKLPSKAHKQLARMTDRAVKMFWQQSGVHSNAFAVRKTHAESIAFLEDHPKMLKAVEHIYEEDSDGSIAKYLNPGFAATALYFMASSTSKPEDYYHSDSPNESLLDFSQWDKACDFFVALSSGDKKLLGVRKAMEKLVACDAAGVRERWTTLAKAWELYCSDDKITLENTFPDLELKDDVYHLVENVSMGGIDIGDDSLEFDPADPDEEEIKKRATKVRAKRPVVEKQAKRKGKEWKKGDKAWIHSPGDDAYFGTLVQNPFSCTDGDVRVFIDAEDGNWEVSIDELSMKQFEMV